jgi:serine/threonine protein kinase
MRKIICTHLHLDTAPRNYLKDNDYHLKITDYGLSRVIPSNGVIKCTSNEARPVRALDVRALIDKEFTIVSDLYALRTAIIEVIGLVLGKPVETLLTYARDKEEGNRASIKNNALSCAITKVGLYKYHNDTNKNELETLANNKSLCVFVKNLEFHLQQKLSEDKTHYQPIKNLLDCYKDYLTHMPTIIRKNDQYTPEEINEIRRKDYKRFTRATENFINTQEHSAKYNSLNVELERLKAISVTLPTNLSIIFQQLEIDKEQLEKKVQELDQIHKESEPNYATGSELEELEALRIRL